MCQNVPDMACYPDFFVTLDSKWTGELNLRFGYTTVR